MASKLRRVRARRKRREEESRVVIASSRRTKVMAPQLRKMGPEVLDDPHPVDLEMAVPLAMLVQMVAAPALVTGRQALTGSAREEGVKAARKAMPPPRTALRKGRKMVLGRRMERKAIAVDTAECAVAEEEAIEVEAVTREEDRNREAEEETVAAAGEVLHRAATEDQW